MCGFHDISVSTSIEELQDNKVLVMAQTKLTFT